jgi:hypothetical protein
MTNQSKLNDYRSIMVDEIKANVKFIYTKLYGQPADDEGYKLKFSDITKQEIDIDMENDRLDCYIKVTLNTIVLIEDDIYMTGFDECNNDVEEIYFDELSTDKIATIADILWNTIYNL